MKSKQLDLFPARTRVRSTDPDTSHETAEKIVKKLTKLQQIVLDYFYSIRPKAITDLDLQEHFKNHKSTYRTRRAELTEMGKIVDTGERKWQEDANRVLWGLAEDYPPLEELPLPKDDGGNANDYAETVASPPR